MANYQLAISNIAWLKDDDEAVYTAMQQAASPGWNWPPPAFSPKHRMKI